MEGGRPAWAFLQCSLCSARGRQRPMLGSAVCGDLAGEWLQAWCGERLEVSSTQGSQAQT